MANRTTPASLSCAAACTTLPCDLPSDKRMAIWATDEELRPPGNPFLRMYLRARPVWVLPPLGIRSLDQSYFFHVIVKMILTENMHYATEARQGQKSTAKISHRSVLSGFLF